MIKTTSMIFNSEMVLALLAGNKTQTRRPVNAKTTELIRCHAGDDGGDEAEVSFAYENAKDDSGKIHDKQWLVYSSEYQEEGVIPLGQCPFGKAGDLIYVRETLGINVYLDMYYSADCLAVMNEEPEGYVYRSLEYVGGIPSIHMPRWASRLTLKINSVRVERIQDISEKDSWAEGFEGYDDDVTGGVNGYSQFCEAWKNIYGASWDKNDWVWVIDFEVIHKNIDHVLEEMEQAA